MISSLNIKIKKKQLKIAVIGLGYVGLPIAKAFSKHFKVIGYDINKGRISDLKNKIDSNDLNKKIKKKFSKNLIFSNKKNV